MMYSINFLDMAAQIDPLTFSKYLSNAGWAQFPRKRDDIKVFQLNNESGFYQVTIPLEPSLIDYEEAMLRAVQTVAESEKKKIEEVMLCLLNPYADIIKIRFKNKNAESGAVLLEEGINLYENAKKLLTAAAQDVLNPVKYHRGRPDDAVMKFVSDCRFGQTEIGSYVVPIVCPFADVDDNNDYQQLTIFSREEQCANSLTRQVTTRVMNNVAEIKHEIVSDQIDNLLGKSEDHLISVNFYEALNGLAPDDGNADIEIIAEWAPNVKNENCMESRITLPHNYRRPIAEVISRYKSQRNRSSKIVGRIKKLESTPDAAKRTTGKITVVYLDETEKKRTVTAELTRADYDKAIRAHEQGIPVEIIGELTEGRRPMISYEAFSVLD